LKVSIKALRVNAELSQQEAADKIGVAPRTLQNWENGVTYPTAVQLVSICSVYNCTMADISLPIVLTKSKQGGNQADENTD
jgi:transcriptional regulator with XRE-family HTH domain